MSMRATMAAAVAATVAVGCGRTANDQIADGAAGPEKTITGCLESGDEDKSYVFRPSSADAKQKDPIYRVVAREGVDLSVHLGKRLTVTGNVVNVPVNISDRKRLGGAVGTSGRAPRNDAEADSPKNGANAAPPQKRPDIVDVPVLRVARIDRIEGRCDGAR